MKQSFALWVKSGEGEGIDRQTSLLPTPLPSLPLGNPWCPFDLVSLLQTTQDGSHWCKGMKLPQASFLGCDLLPLPCQTGGLEGKGEERYVSSADLLVTHPLLAWPEERGG